MLSNDSILEELKVLKEENEELRRREAEQRATLEKLKKYSLEYKTLFENTGTATVIFDDSKTIRMCNRKFLDLAGLPEKEIIGKKWDMFVSEKDKEKLDERHRLRSIDPEIPPSNYEFDFVDSKGIKKNIYIEIVRIENSDKRIASLLDITWLKNTESELKESLKELEVITASIPNVIWKAEVDSKGNFVNTYISESINDFLGYSPNSFGHNWSKYFNLILPKYLPQIMEKFQKGIENIGKTISFVYEIKKANGEIAWLSSSGRAFYENGKIKIYGSSIDISKIKETEEALKESEEKYRSFLENASEAILLTDEEGNIIEWNNAMEELSAIPKTDAQKRKLWDIQFQLTIPEYKTDEIFSSIKNKLIQFYKNGNIHFPSKNYETKIYAAGNVKDVLQSSFIIKTSSGFRLATISWEITERNKLKDELEKTNKQLKTFTRHIQILIEEEKRYAAQEIHDKLGQGLSALKIDLMRVHNNVSNSDKKVINGLSEMKNLIDDLITIHHRIVMNLRPGMLDDLGIGTALGWYAKETAEQFNTNIVLTTNPEELQIPEPYSTECFRIAQEAIRNAAINSNSKNVEVLLWLEKNIIFLTVRDDGKSKAEDNSNSVNSDVMLNIKERVVALLGDINISDKTDKGRSIKIRIPINENLTDRFEKTVKNFRITNPQ